MTSLAVSNGERRQWAVAGACAVAVHVSVALMILAWTRPVDPVVSEPVVLVELPPEAPRPSEAAVSPATQPVEATAPSRSEVAPPASIPLPRAPGPADATPVPLPVITPRVAAPIGPPSPQPVIAQTAAVSAAAPAPGDDKRAKQQEVDYFALISAHLNRRKVYPVEARKARQQGVVTVRFTVDRAGAVSDVSIKRSSQHAILDAATLDLMQRVAPLPRMPASMQRDRITVSLPIDYSLRTS